MRGFFSRKTWITSLGSTAAVFGFPYPVLYLLREDLDAASDSGTDWDAELRALLGS